LVKRRAAEAKLWNTPSVTPVAPAPVDITPASPIPTKTLPEPAQGRGVNWWVAGAIVLVIACLAFAFLPIIK
jgi:hypothetical protein